MVTMPTVNKFGEIIGYVSVGIREKFAKVMNQYGIMFTRIPMELDLSSCNWLTTAEESFCTAVVKHCERAKEIFVNYNLRFTHGFVGLTTVGIHMTTERLCSRINCFFENAQRKLHDERQTTISCELMVHPGYRCRGVGGCGGPSGPDDFARSDEREHELAILNSHKLKEFYLEQRFELCPKIH